jgi:hypothetical protein
MTPPRRHAAVESGGRRAATVDRRGRGIDVRAQGRIVGAMGEVLLAVLGPTVGFGLFALLAFRFGAESRPYFDERPVLDERPNWFPIAGATGTAEDDDADDDGDDGEPHPVRAPRAAPVRRQPARPLASPSSAATSPSGV